jgi:hypothetical protein
MEHNATRTSRLAVQEYAPIARSHDPAPPPIESLVLNCFPATFSTKEISLLVGRWTTPEAADTLRAEHAGLSTWRDVDDGSRLYAWNASAPIPYRIEGFSEVTVRLDESPLLFQRLLMDAVQARLLSLGFEEKGGGFANFKGKSILADIPALAGAVGESIGIYPKIITEGFVTRASGGNVSVFLTVDILYTTRMDVTAAEWIAAGLAEELPGKYAVLVAGCAEAARFPEFVGHSIGCINGLRSDKCVLTDLRDPALAEVPASSVAPEATRKNLAAYLMARHEKAFRASEGDLLKRLRELVRPRTRHKYADGLVRQRIQKEGTADALQILPGVTVRFGQMAKAGPDCFPVRKLLDPEFSFDAAGNKYSRRVDMGLQRFGPFDGPRMRREEFRVLVVAPANNKGDVTLAVQKILSGVKTPQNVFTGLKQMYRLENLQMTTVFADPKHGASMQGYSEAIRTAVREAPTPVGGGQKFHLVLTVIHAAHRNLPDLENPYYQTKGQAIVIDGMPTQAITVEKLRASDYDLQYTLNTMSLAFYAKLGGTSHVMKLPTEEPGAPTELIFGVGRAFQRHTRFGKGEETIGFATVFRANGEYLYNDCTPYCDVGDYERALEHTIRRTVEGVAAFEQLTEGAPLRLIFHVPRRPGRHEERAILNAVGKLSKFKVDFAILHVNDDHHIQMFDTANTNPKTGKGTPRPEAALLPARGWSVEIGPRERLISFVGPGQYKGNGCPTPLRVTWDKRSTFPDIEYLTQQLYYLSFMSARSLTPGVTPVTIAYAEQLARLTSHLRSVGQWTVDMIQEKLGHKLWFV